MAAIIQLLLILAWGLLLLGHTRRLYRLASVPVTSDRKRYLRSKAERMWWWLGREEFWRAVQADGVYCMQLTVMVFLLAWGLLS